MRLGVYIGSFNPVHNGHIKVINYLLDNDYIDKVLIVPTLEYWDKQNLASIKDRINMLKFFQNSKVMIDEEHNHLIYTYDLLKKLEKIYNKDKLYLIIGSDNIINFDKWKKYDELLKYPIIIMNRNNIDIYNYVKKFATNNFIIVDNYPFIPISSTKLRKKLDNKYLDSRVIHYIKENNLYRGNDGKNK